MLRFIANQEAFFGTSENAVKSQIWIAVSVYVFVAIVKKRLKLSATLEKAPLLNRVDVSIWSGVKP